MTQFLIGFALLSMMIGAGTCWFIQHMLATRINDSVFEAHFNKYHMRYFIVATVCWHLILLISFWMVFTGKVKRSR
jgi:hypothetical protein